MIIAARVSLGSHGLIIENTILISKKGELRGSSDRSIIACQVLRDQHQEPSNGQLRVLHFTSVLEHRRCSLRPRATLLQSTNRRSKKKENEYLNKAIIADNQFDVRLHIQNTISWLTLGPIQI